MEGQQKQRIINKLRRLAKLIEDDNCDEEDLVYSYEYTIDDERQQGRNINVEFNGELRPEQNKAVKELTKHDNV